MKREKQRFAMQKAGFFLKSCIFVYDLAAKALYIDLFGENINGGPQKNVMVPFDIPGASLYNKLVRTL